MTTRRAMTLLAASTFVCAPLLRSDAAYGKPQAKKKEYTQSFDLSACTFSSSGRNTYFVLDPGFQATLKGREGKHDLEVRMTVLTDVEVITIPGLAPITTRVLEESEFEDGAQSEISRNFFAICDQTSDVYYFGEDVDIYEDGQVVGHDGAWRAGVDGALPGLAMPGTFLLGSRYFQEVAPGVAMDRAEHVKTGLEVDVPFGHFTDAVQVVETSSLSRSDKDVKIYAPGVGVIVDETLELTDVIDPGP